tara:strand:+ start:406 stop:2553 length:2148 start_codon:yes stop_codon:yes gene_type:complete
MANTYFKYAERNAENRINWADVGKDMTDMLADEARVRGEKKAAIETDFREFGKTLAESPMGKSEGFNEFTTDYADSAQEYSLMVNNMLKSGDLKLRDYNNIQANLKQGTSEAFSIAEDYNKAYEGMLERGEIDPATGLPSAQLLEQYVLGTVQGFGNYSDHRLWINPTTGKVSLASTRTDEETGEVTMDRDTGSFIAVNALRNRTRAQYDTYDLNKINAARVDTLGTTINAVMRGGVKTREKALENASVRQVLDDFADATVAIPTNVSSILTNSLGTNPANGRLYAFTDSPADAAADENLILVMDNPLQKSAGLPMPAYLDSPEKLTEYLNENFEDLSYTDDEGNDVSHADAVAQIVENNKKQVDVARATTKTSLVSMLDDKETTMAEFNNRKYNDERRGDAQTSIDAATNIGYLFNGTEDQANGALRFLEGLNPDVKRIELEGDMVVLYEEDAKGNLVPLESYPKGDNIDNFVEGLLSRLVPGSENVAEALEKSKLDREKEKTSNTSAAGRKKNTVKAIPLFDEKMDPDADFSDTPSDIFNEEFGLGFTGSGEDRVERTEVDGYEAQTNAEASFLSKVGIPNAVVVAVYEDDIQDYIDYGDGYNAGALSNDNSVTQLFIPDVMTMPLMIPDGTTAQQFEAINRKILEAARNGDLLTPNDFKTMVDEWAQYNNEKMAKDYLGIEWSNGDGPQPLTDGQVDAAVTARVTTDTSSYN